MTCYAGALAVNDAGLTYAAGAKQDIGLLATNVAGCVAANSAYFEDYVRCGRTLGRGNLFIYTLPTSPLAEAAIHFGFRGPLLYIGGRSEMLAEALRTGGAMVRSQAASAMLVFRADDRHAVCFALSAADGGPGLCPLETAVRAAEGEPDLAALTGRLEPPR
jgi:hypothetical protein